MAIFEWVPSWSTVWAAFCMAIFYNHSFKIIKIIVEIITRLVMEENPSLTAEWVSWVHEWLFLIQGQTSPAGHNRTANKKGKIDKIANQMKSSEGRLQIKINGIFRLPPCNSSISRLPDWLLLWLFHLEASWLSGGRAVGNIETTWRTPQVDEINVVGAVDNKYWTAMANICHCHTESEHNQQAHAIGYL